MLHFQAVEPLVLCLNHPNQGGLSYLNYKIQIRVDSTRLVWLLQAIKQFLSHVTTQRSSIAMQCSCMSALQVCGNTFKQSHRSLLLVRFLQVTSMPQET